MSLILDPEAPNLRTLVAAEVVSYLLETLDITLPVERRARIAESLDYYVALGAGGALSFTLALQDEYLLYGEPGAEDTVEPLGILRGVK